MSIHISSNNLSDTITISPSDAISIDLGDMNFSTADASIVTTPAQTYQWNGMAGGAGYTNIKTVETFSDFLKSEKPPSTVYDLDIDPFAAIIEIRDEGRFPEIGLIKSRIPSQESNCYAQTIREYYLDKIVTQKLSSTYHDTDFKRDMVKALKLSGKQVLEDQHIRLLYRLPDFYKEDTFLDSIVENHISFDTSQTSRTIKNISLSYLGSLDFYRRGARAKNFYFKDTDNKIFLISASHATNLLPITKVFDKIKSMVVSGQVNYSRIKGHDFTIASLDHKYNIEEFTF